MTDPLLILTFLVGFLSSIVSGIAGAGAGLVSAPYLMLIGVPPLQAVATPKLLGFGLGLGSITRFQRNGNINWHSVKILIPVGLLASTLGTYLVIQIDDSIIKYVVATATIAIAIATLSDRKMGVENRHVGKVYRALGVGLFAITDFLRGAFGSGLGTINMAIFMKFLGFDAITANAVKRVVTFPTFLVSIAIFSSNDAISWDHGIALLIGGVLGGYIGSHIAIKKGSKFVKNLFVIVVLIMALSLLFV